MTIGHRGTIRHPGTLSHLGTLQPPQEPQLLQDPWPPQDLQPPWDPWTSHDARPPHEHSGTLGSPLRTPPGPTATSGPLAVPGLSATLRPLATPGPSITHSPSPTPIPPPQTPFSPEGWGDGVGVTHIPPPPPSQSLKPQGDKSRHITVTIIGDKRGSWGGSLNPTSPSWGGQGGGSSWLFCQWMTVVAHGWVFFLPLSPRDRWDGTKHCEIFWGDPPASMSSPASPPLG